MEEFPVQLWIYDLSNGIASRLSKFLSSKEIEGIWHTSIVVYDKEFWYGKGITTAVPGTCSLGLPHQIMALGTTRIDERTFNEFLDETGRFYTAERYHLLGFNCNSFSNLCAAFLTGHSIPEMVQDLPIDFVSTTIGWLTDPIIQSIYKTALPKEAAGNATLRAMSNGDDTKDAKDGSNASYGQAISSAASSTGRAALAVGGKALRLVMNTSTGIASSSNISGWRSSS